MIVILFISGRAFTFICRLDTPAMCFFFQKCALDCQPVQLSATTSPYADAGWLLLQIEKPGLTCQRVLLEPSNTLVNETPELKPAPLPSDRLLHPCKQKNIGSADQQA